MVGLLIRARKKGLVEFEGEMLYQGQDDDEPILLVSKPHDLIREVGFSGLFLIVERYSIIHAINEYYHLNQSLNDLFKRLLLSIFIVAY